LLTLIYTLNFLDRSLIILLLQSIKTDLVLTDTQLGLLTGIAFGLFYATLGLPIARWADHGNRVTIVSIAIGLWGVTVMACMLVTNFIQLLLARTAAGVGEAGCMPPTYSLLGDYFPKSAERTWAMVIYWLANPLAALISFVIGGWLNEVYGWRETFFLMSVPALLLAVVAKVTIKEPRTSSASPGGSKAELPGWRVVLKVLWQQPSTRHLSLGIIVVFTMALGMAPWYAAFMIRTHAMGTAELGVWLGLIFGIGGAAGTLLGGYVAERWFADNERGQMRITALMIASLTPSFALFLVLQDKHHALLAFVPLMVVFYFFVGPTFALLQRLVVDEMRATTLALVMLFANLIGMGIGSQVVGVLSDLLMPSLGSDSLRYAMLAMSVVALWAAVHFWRVGTTVNEDLSALSNSVQLNGLRETSGRLT
jgi:MFS family permease